MRYSSTTYCATKLNRQELSYRYGWVFSSDMLDEYISRVSSGLRTWTNSPARPNWAT
ncbi:MAG: hypothetical protein WCL11_07545 [Verrucomicrobiota bacterium]